MKLISKGQNLSQLSGDKYFKEFIPPLLLIRPNTYLKRKKYFLNFIKKKFKNKIIIRSSSDDEDQLSKSNAGKYDSYLNLKNDDYKNINDSIIKIIQKYLLYSTNGGILIQEMITNSKISGVLTTTLSNGNKNYIEINYSRGKKTNIVTSGKKGSKNLILFKSLKIPKRYEFFSKLIALSKKLSTVFKNDSLDIEFSITKENKIKIFQVRPLIIKKIHTISLNEQNIFLSALKKKIDKLKKKHDFLYGNTTYFGVMPDWNPAEIIGMKPKNLSYNL